MTQQPFNSARRRLVRDRAQRQGAELFLHQRSFDDCLERVGSIARRFERALLVGCPDPEWPDRLRNFVPEVDVVDPGELFAAAANGVLADEDSHDFGENQYDLIICLGTFDTVNGLPQAIAALVRALKPSSPILGALAGGNTLETLRRTLIDAERDSGAIPARTHPRIDAPTLSRLLVASGLDAPIVDIDRVRLRYATLPALVRDLRSMAASNQLQSVAPLNPSVWRKAERRFHQLGDGVKTAEIVEILHFLAWSPASRKAAG